MKKYWIYILTLIFWQAQAQNLPEVSAKADTLQIRIGEQIKLQAEAKADTLSFVDFPEISELGDMEVVGSSGVDTLQAKPYRHLRKEYYLTQWDSGEYTIAPLRIKINDSLMSTDSLRIKVLPVAVDTTQQGLFDFKAPVNLSGKDASKEIKKRLSPWWWLLLLPLTALGYYLYKRRKAVIEARKKVLTPYEKAVAELNKLKEEKLWLKDKVDEQYLRLTDLLKNYLEGELHLSAKEKISAEILQDLKKYRFEDGRYFPVEMIERLKETFRRADLAKFAKLVPNAADIDLDYKHIKDLIDYAHSIVQEIADAKAAELAEKEAAKKRKKRIAWGIAAGIVFVLALLGGGVYYWLHKNNLTKNLIENVSSPEWVYNEYGSSPALGLTTPHILHWFDLKEALDSIPEAKLMFDEISAYIDENPIKKYMILEGNMDFKNKLPVADMKILDMTIEGMLKEIKAKEVNIHQADIEGGKRYFGDFARDIPGIGNNVKIAFDSRFYLTKNGEKYVIGMYLKGDKENKELIERVLESAELVND